MPIKFFHGSYDVLPLGTVLSPHKGNFMRTLLPEEMESHFKLELFRPVGSLSRNRAVYMTCCIEDVDTCGGAAEHIYRVMPLGPVEKHDLNWMSEIDLIFSELSDAADMEAEDTISRVQMAALNYWEGVPHYNECCWEYLTTLAKITKEV